jgi:hypothetical protein
LRLILPRWSEALAFDGTSASFRKSGSGEQQLLQLRVLEPGPRLRVRITFRVVAT